jgi:hypothetical protein
MVWNQNLILQNMKFVPWLLVNLSFSIRKALKNGFNLGNEDGVIKLMKENTALRLEDQKWICIGHQVDTNIWENSNYCY